MAGWLLVAVVIAAGRSSGAQGGLEWQWSHPEPHGNNVADIVFREGRYYHVTDYGGFYTTTNLAFWVRKDSGTDLDLRSLAFLGQRLLVTGEGGAAFWSDDGESLQAAVVSPATTDWLEGVAASATSAVAVGDNGAIYRTTDGQSWQRVAVGRFTAWLSGVAWGGGVYVAVGENGFIATSPNGTDWTPRSSGTPSNLWRVVYANGEFMAVGSGGTVLLSANGVAWSGSPTASTESLYGGALTSDERVVSGVATVLLKRGRDPWRDQTSAQQSSSPAPPWSYSAVIWDGSRYVLAGRTGVFVESYQVEEPGFEDDTFWFRSEETPRNTLWAAERLGGTSLAVGELTTVLSSTGGGAEWLLESVPPTNFPTLYGVGGSGDRAVAVGSDGLMLLSVNQRTSLLVTNLVPVGGRTISWVSTQAVDLLGIEWTVVGEGVTPNALQGVGWDGRQFLVVGSGGTVLRSPDGEAWTAGGVGASGAVLTGVTPYAGGWVVSGSQGALFTSRDGRQWTDRSLGVTNWVYRVRDVGEALVAVGQGGFMRVSPDGERWEARAFPTDIWLTDVRRVGGSVYVCGTRGSLWRSRDLRDWEAVFTPTGKAFYALLVDRGTLFALGAEGMILRAVAEAGPAGISAYERRRDAAGAVDLFQFDGTPEVPFRLQGTDDFRWGVDAELQLDSDGTAVFGREATPPWRFYRTVVP